MSVASYSDRQDVSLYKKPSIQRRNYSGELDVFEAANYFSTHDQPSLVINKPNKENFTTISCKDFQAWKPAGVRMSIDVPGRGSKSRVTEIAQTGHSTHSVQVVKEKIIKQTKQPSSPGGRIASFLTSLFTNTTSKKKKKLLEEDQRPRRRRNSISYVDSRSLYSESKSVSGFRTPPPLYKTFFDDSKSLKDYKRVTQTPSLPKNSNGSLSAFSNKINANGLADKEMVFADKKIDFEVNDKIVKEPEAKNAADNNIVKDFELKKIFHQDDDEGDDHSDTSSDLFELPNYDLGEFPSGLPVYETTNVDQIKNSAKPVSN